MTLKESPMEFVLAFEGVGDLIWDRMTFKELNHLRACSKELQKMVSMESEKTVNKYIKILNRKITRLQPANTCFDIGYIVIYNYYHTLAKYSCLMMNSQTHTEFQNLMRRFHTQKKTHIGKRYVLDEDRYKLTDIDMQCYTLFDIMTYIYLTNTGSEWASFHWDKEGLNEMKYLQGKLLPYPNKI